MSDKKNHLIAEVRNKSGKGVARSLRREGKIPGIIYGDNQPELRVATALRDFVKEYNSYGFDSRVYDLEIDGNIHKVLPREVQTDPVTDKPIHVDFLRVNADKKLRVSVPVRFLNSDKSPGLKKGGVLNIIRRKVELFCNPASIPARLEIDLSGKQIGESIHISSIKLPQGIVPTITDRDFTIATIVGRGGKSAEDDQGSAEASTDSK